MLDLDSLFSDKHGEGEASGGDIEDPTSTSISSTSSEAASFDLLKRKRHTYDRLAMKKSVQLELTDVSLKYLVLVVLYWVKRDEVHHRICSQLDRQESAVVAQKTWRAEQWKIWKEAERSLQQSAETLSETLAESLVLQRILRIWANNIEAHLWKCRRRRLANREIWRRQERVEWRSADEGRVHLNKGIMDL